MQGVLIFLGCAAVFLAIVIPAARYDEAIRNGWVPPKAAPQQSGDAILIPRSQGGLNIGGGIPAGNGLYWVGE